jgi:hypothetical protein
MFTILAFGLCGMILEKDAGIHSQAVGIGVADNGKCQVRLVLPEGPTTPLLMVNGFPHTFRVEKIGDTSAVVWIDNSRSFFIPRTNVLQSSVP